MEPDLFQKCTVVEQEAKDKSKKRTNSDQKLTRTVFIMRKVNMRTGCPKEL